MSQNENAKIGKIIARFNARVQEGEYYEANQILRTVTSRYVKGEKWAEAVEVITRGIHTLINAKRGAEAADLTRYLLTIYTQGDFKCDESNIARLIDILTVFDVEEPSIKEICTRMNNWSTISGLSTYGDPNLHLVIGRRLLEAGYVYEAERYFVLGTSDSAKRYIEFLWDWFQQINDSSQVAVFYSRIVFNYLSIFNIKFALLGSIFLDKFIECYQPDHEIIEKKFATIRYFKDYSELNFLQLIIVACQTKNSEYYTSLKTQYTEYAEKYPELMAFIAKEYFQIKTHNQINLLEGMMKNFFNDL